ncbi:RuBisCO accumulation factor 1 [Capilliphycus salinus ALCB114379]|uniref:RuBisCO accumulation factor 1 n=1 Tax=Capilliphycus salinus TaxID=2768948 RepID=UPI0039A447F0
MTGTPQNNPNPQPSNESGNLEELLQLLRRKQGTWVEWGQACATLQKSGYNSQQLFEETGFEPVQQNQVIVASQVYNSLVTGDASEGVRSHFLQKGSDILYEYRILTQPQRIEAAEFSVSQNIDADEAKELAKAIKDMSRLSSLPEGFTQSPGDAIAYQCWKAARQHSDLQQRSRLIAKALKFVQSSGAREQVEKLLTDFSVVSTRPAPRLPVYRLESDEDLPRILPVVGEFPLTLEDLKAVPITDEEKPFGMVKFSGQGAWIPLPGWQVITNAEDPVVIIGKSDSLPNPLPGKVEPVLVVIDRSQRNWEADRYFLVERDNQLELQWFEEDTEVPLLGQLILIMRPKKVLDESQIWNLMQFED